MNTQNWLTLMEYSAQYRVSLSTLRRRIKAGEIEHKLIEGKYLLRNELLQPKTVPAEPIAPPTQVNTLSEDRPLVKEPVAPVTAVRAGPVADQFWDITQALLAEIKSAYALSVQEKEASMVRLQSEIGDLKTLVRVLEQENEKLKTRAQPSLGSGFDLGLDI